MVRRRLALFGIGGVYAGVGLLRWPACAAEFSYKLGISQTPASPPTARAIEAAAKIKEASSGRLDITVFPNNQLGSDVDTLSQLRLGGVEFEILGTSILVNIAPACGICALPFTFSDFRQAYSAIDGRLGEYIRSSLAKVGVFPLHKMWDSGFKQIVSTRPISKPEDLSGVKIGIVPSPLPTATFRALGASPTALPLPEYYTGMQTHIVDALDVSLGGIDTSHFYEVGKYLALTHHNWTSLSLVASPAAWQRLPKNLQELAEQQFDTAAVAERQDVVQRDATLASKLQSVNGMTVTQVDFAAFQSVLRKAGLFAQWRQDYGADAWVLLEKAVGRKLA